MLAETGVLPSGVSFHDNGDGTATLSGTPGTGTGGSYSFVITAVNGISPSDTQSFTLTVNEGLAITSGTATTFAVGTLGTFQVTTSGFPKPSLSESGPLPIGVTFTDNANGTATISGTPANGTGGSYTLAVTASNGDLVTQSFTLTVNEPPSVTSAASTTFVTGMANSFSVTTSGFPQPQIFESGTLPTGVSFTDNGDGTATLSGTPIAGTQGTYPVTPTPANGLSPHTAQSFMLTVRQATVNMNTAVFDAATSAAWTGTETTGASAFDTSTVSPTEDFVPTGTVTYSFFTNSSCEGAGASTDPQPMSNGTAPASPLTDALARGSYSYDASYSGDTNYAASTASCEPFTVGLGTAPVATVVNDAATNAPWDGNEVPGSSAFDTSTVTPSAAGFTATGTVTYELFTNSTCTLPASTTRSATLDPTGAVPNSDQTGPLTTGQYSFQALYSGDSNYGASTAACEPFAVLPATVGPVFPAPGSGSFSRTGNGVGTAGGVTWTDSGIDTTQFRKMVWGAAYPGSPITYSFGDGTATLAFDAANSNLGAGVARYSSTVNFQNVNGTITTLPVRFTFSVVTVPSFEAVPVSGLTIDSGVGAVLPVTGTFSVNWLFEVSPNGGTSWIPANDYFNSTPHAAGPGTSSSVSGGFWYTPPSG